MLVLMPYLVAMFVPMAALYYWLQRSYSHGYKPLKTAEAKKLEPVIGSCRDALEGLITIRAFGREEVIIGARLGPAIRTAGSYSAAAAGVASCLAFRANTAIYGVLVFVTSIIMGLKYQPSPLSIAPMILSNIFQLSGVMGAAAMAASDLENNLLSAGRLIELAGLVDEEAVSVGELDLISGHGARSG